MTADSSALGADRVARPHLPAASEPQGLRWSVLAPTWASLGIALLVATLGMAGMGAHPVWLNVQLTMAAIGAGAICWSGLRAADEPQARAFLRTTCWAVGLWLVIQVTWLARAAAIDIAPQFVQLALAGLLVVVAARVWRLLLRDRFSVVDTAAVYLDSASVALILAAAILLGLGPAALTDPAEADLVLFAVLLGGIIGGFLVLYLALVPARGPFGALAVLAGLLTLSVGLLGRAGLDPAGWHAFDLLAAVGTIVTAYGCATWSATVDANPRFRRMAKAIRAGLPLVAVGAAPLILLSNEVALDSNGPMLGMLVDGAVALVLISSVLRQTLLLWERGRITEVAIATAERERSLATDLQARELRFRTLVQNSTDVVLTILPDGEVTYQSPAVERVLGYPPDDRPGHQVHDWVHPDDAAYVRSMLAELAQTPGATRTVELRSRHADGSWRTLEATGTNLLDDPVIGAIVVNYRDVTERKVLEQQLIHEAFHDPLTGLANRALFADRVDHALTRRDHAGRLAVLFMDVDDFKTINDSLGHSAGDLVLVAVAERLRACLRPEDTICRLGGDEFAVLVEDDAEDLAGRLAERVLQTLRLPFEIAGKQVHLGASIGIAPAGSETRTASELLRNADVAMYTAKSGGKGRVAVFESSMHAAVLDRLEIKADLERAIARDELRLRFQPVFDLRSERLAGFECLLRWRHPERGELLPGQFIGLAEETGLIVPIGRWVLEQACRQARAWSEMSPDAITVSVNVAARQLREADFAEQVTRALEGASLPPERLMLELTETSLMQDDEGRLAELRRVGVRLALDDFGTGYSSLSYLSRFPIDQLKVDRSFVAKLGGDQEETALVTSVVQLAAAMEMQTVAEGIERPEQLQRVMQLGCDFGQGFLLARPMDSIRATNLLTSGASLQPGRSVGA